MSSDYNQGTEDDRREALRGAVDYTKLLTTFATGAVVLTATFLDSLYAGRNIELLIVSWIAFGLSVLAGLIAFGEYVSQFSESTLKARRGTMEFANFAQWILVAAGAVFFAIFAISNVTANPTIEIARDESGVSGKHARTTFICPSNALHGCSGMVSFRLLGRSSKHGFDLGEAPFSTGSARLITASSPRRLPALRRRPLASKFLRIEVTSTSSYGDGWSVSETVPAREIGGGRGS